MSLLETLSKQLGRFDDIDEIKRPPIEQWNPELSGDIDIQIKADGTWWHEGTQFTREKLVRLFSTILKKEGSEYFLVTPVEKWRIQVEAHPFVVIMVQFEGNKIHCVTNVGDAFTVDGDHAIELDHEGIPHVQVRDNLTARFNRNAFYELASKAKEKDGVFYVKSSDLHYCIG
ncbi:DUF1285 domain-containing protein [Bermanella marisrubri]|uniref:Proteophosphoglycan n=1 Tax=Bermanella marisrubri TaxID=207949 RepID=Q1MY03_9GAMM|nr:DUF1285 domain-containing protein [Bermanella marisrubri]EAT10826.1 hypothetical protein RED65_07034 [Oceanobacter sp. RED65] [Bermanella marisrubri]QIZ84208.1 DUF1285 domain-containing protein [Bermanella marisrubri]